MELLQNARATVFPIFVAGAVRARDDRVDGVRHAGDRTRWGAVLEVIDHGVTGIIVDDWRETENVLDDADALDPAAMRRAVEERFTPARMVADYVAAYEAAAHLGGVEAPAGLKPVRRRDPPLAVPALGALAAELLLPPRRHRGRRSGRSQLAALGVSAVILTTLFAIFNFLQYGTTAQVGRASGAGQSRRRGGSARRRSGSPSRWGSSRRQWPFSLPLSSS